jgi:folate-binding protein YgfZ
MGRATGLFLETAEVVASADSEGAFGTGANSARISRLRPHEIPAKTKMSKSGIDLRAGPDALGVIRVAGVDAARFLQGQLSADVEKIAPGAGALAGLHNPQGRVVALLALVRPGAEEILAALPRELVETVVLRFRKYVLRAKVRIDDASAAWRAVGIEPIVGSLEPSAGAPSLAWGSRRLAMIPMADSDWLLHDGAAAARWSNADVAEGLPQVYAATSESFVAQMLNLDLLGAIAFDKGCYTGQEVIARAHYRGRVKRRLQRWSHAGPQPLAPGTAARSPDGRALVVVRTAPAGIGGAEVLAIGNFGPVADDAAATADGGVPVLQGPLPLPYALPADS